MSLQMWGLVGGFWEVGGRVWGGSGGGFWRFGVGFWGLQPISTVISKSQHTDGAVPEST